MAQGARFVITELLPSGAPGVPRRLVLTEQEQIIGRSDMANLVIPLRTMSRRHAAVWVERGTGLVRDLDSRSGTYVNSTRVGVDPAPLRQGDLLSFRPNLVFLVSQEDAPLTGDALAELALSTGASDSTCRRYTEALLQLTDRLGTIYDESKLLASALEVLERGLTAERFFAMLGSDPGNLRILARKLVNPERSEHWGLPSKEILRRTMLSERPVISFDAQSDERFCRRTSIAMSEVHSAIGVALRIEDTCLGVLYADDQLSGGRFAIDDGRFMQSVARVIAVELLRLRGRTERQNLAAEDGRVELRGGIEALAERLESIIERLAPVTQGDAHTLVRQLRAECRGLRDLADRSGRRPRPTMPGIGKLPPPED